MVAILDQIEVSRVVSSFWPQFHLGLSGFLWRVVGLYLGIPIGILEAYLGIPALP